MLPRTIDKATRVAGGSHCNGGRMSPCFLRHFVLVVSQESNISLIDRGVSCEKGESLSLVFLIIGPK